MSWHPNFFFDVVNFLFNCTIIKINMYKIKHKLNIEIFVCDCNSIIKKVNQNNL
jgi:hypothetical protein